MTMKIDKKFFKSWVKALRSGKYKQGFGKLKSEASGRYCCLGVACHLKAKQTKKAVRKFTFHRVALDGDGFAGSWLLPREQQKYLTNLNDVKKLTFNQIADYIERKYLSK